MSTPSIYQRAHVFLTDNGNDELLEVAAKTGGNGVDDALRAMFRTPDKGGAGFSALKVKTLDGQTLVNSELIPLLVARRNELAKSEGLHFVVGGWAQAHYDAESEATLAAHLVSKYGLQYWEACCEQEFKDDRTLSRRYTQTFRALRPTMTLGLCSMPNEPTGDFIDWQAWRDAAARWIPECNPDQFPTEPSQWPLDAYAVALREFFKSYIHPSFGMYPGAMRVTAAEYVLSLSHAKAAGFTYGYSVYSAHYLSGDDWRTFAAVNGKVGDANALAWHP